MAEPRSDKPPSAFAEFRAFLRENRRWWLLPILLVVVLFALLVVLGSTPIGSFVYTRV